MKNLENERFQFVLFRLGTAVELNSFTVILKCNSSLGFKLFELTLKFSFQGNI